jgi:hypothetical protein
MGLPIVTIRHAGRRNPGIAVARIITAARTVTTWLVAARIVTPWPTSAGFINSRIASPVTARVTAAWSTTALLIAAHMVTAWLSAACPTAPAPRVRRCGRLASRRLVGSGGCAAKVAAARPVAAPLLDARLLTTRLNSAAVLDRSSGHVARVAVAVAVPVPTTGFSQRNCAREGKDAKCCRKSRFHNLLHERAFRTDHDSIICPDS